MFAEIRYDDVLYTNVRSLSVNVEFTVFESLDGQLWALAYFIILPIFNIYSKNICICIRTINCTITFIFYSF